MPHDVAHGVVTLLHLADLIERFGFRMNGSLIVNGSGCHNSGVTPSRTRRHLATHCCRVHPCGQLFLSREVQPNEPAIRARSPLSTRHGVSGGSPPVRRRCEAGNVDCLHAKLGIELEAVRMRLLRSLGGHKAKLRRANRNFALTLCRHTRRTLRRCSPRCHSTCSPKPETERSRTIRNRPTGVRVSAHA